ncbi:MAG: hypothetical protein QNJ44_16805 [Rhodobacter sp.]|nr:hypothetical protein [Rhodobacter sp.]
MALIAVGGIVVTQPLKRIEFSLYILPVLLQARRAHGNLHAEVTFRDDIHFSLTAWNSPAAMKRYAQSLPHRLAMARAPRLADFSQFHHWHADNAPDWTEAIDRWKQATGYGARKAA